MWLPVSLDATKLASSALALLLALALVFFLLDAVPTLLRGFLA
jgi:hypothetical protein